MPRYKNNFAGPLSAAVFGFGLLISLTIEAAESKNGPAPAKDAETFVLQTGQEVISVLNETDGHQANLKRLFRTRFDYKLMGRYAMGRYWDKAEAGQRTEYTELFAEYVPNGYISRLSEYRDAAIALVKSRALAEGDALVTTRLQPQNGDPLTFDWRVRAQDQQFKVIDIVFGSVSYMKTLREQFTSIAARNGVDGLLDLLRKHTVKNAAAGDKEFQNLASKLRETDAIDTATKLSLKVKVDRLITDLERHHDGDTGEELDTLKQRFDRLIENVVALLAERNPSLATDIAVMQRPLWRALRDPDRFVVVAMQ